MNSVPSPLLFNGQLAGARRRKSVARERCTHERHILPKERSIPLHNIGADALGRVDGRGIAWDNGRHKVARSNERRIVRSTNGEVRRVRSRAARTHIILEEWV